MADSFMLIGRAQRSNQTLSLANIEYQFPDAERIEAGFIRCADVTARSTYHYYLSLGVEHSARRDLILVSEDRVDDDFAALVLSAALDTSDDPGLQKVALPENGYGFDALILAPSDFHSYFEGRLDAERDQLVLAIPIYDSEFTGKENADEFRLLANKIVPHRDWSRFAHPRTLLRFDNPVTGGGTTGDGYIFATYDLVMRELANLDGVDQGFIELVNHRGAVLELLSPRQGEIVTIAGRDDATRTPSDPDAVADIVWTFLASP